jgi:RNA methyltransferase, TrmH family
VTEATRGPSDDTAGAGSDDAAAAPYGECAGRVAAARRLTRRPAREAARAFLAEGPQPVREALALATARPGAVPALFGTDEALRRHADLAAIAGRVGVPVSRITPRAAAGLSETTTPQGLVAVCRFLDIGLPEAFAAPPPSLAVLLVAVGDPGNAGTVLRSADAAGAGAVVLAAGSVDPYNGKAVRASAGSLFHLPVVRGAELTAAVDAARAAGLAVLAADAAGEADLDDLADDGTLARPTAWLFGNEARGLPPAAAALADHRVRIPIHRRAESLNLAAAAAVCLFASARAQRRPAGNLLGKIANPGVRMPPRAMP